MKRSYDASFVYFDKWEKLKIACSRSTHTPSHTLTHSHTHPHTHPLSLSLVLLLSNWSQAALNPGTEWQQNHNGYRITSNVCEEEAIVRRKLCYFGNWAEFKIGCRSTSLSHSISSLSYFSSLSISPSISIFPSIPLSF